MSEPLTEMSVADMREGYHILVPSRYRVSDDLLKAKTVGSAFFWPEMSYFSGGEWVCVKKPGDWTTDREITAHIAALGGSNSASVAILLRSTLEKLTGNGIRKVTFGADPDHLFPGCPSDAPNIEVVLSAAGFSLTGEAYDVETNLADYQVPTGVSMEGINVRRAVAEDHDDLEEFFKRVFPGRWRHDVLDRHRSSPADIKILHHEGRIEGFALTQNGSSSATPIAGGNWHLDLGENWAALGPIGISESVRGRGWGHALLAWSLMDLKESGVRRTIIDWTSLLDFYGRHGFTKARTYRYATKTLTR